MPEPIQHPDFATHSDQELLASIAPNATVYPTDVLGFIDRRHAAEREQRLVDLTRHVRNLAWAAVLIAGLSLVVALVAVGVTVAQAISRG